MIVLSGIKPTGKLHLGNYVGMIRPALSLMKDQEGLFFLADLHALNTIGEGKALRENSYDLAAGMIALGLSENAVVFRQSDIYEIPFLSTLLSNLTSKGILNRAHAYKAISQANRKLGKSSDKGINVGLYSYPILMAADILLYGSSAVPVGKDQVQHIEIACAIAKSFNSTYGNVFTIPRAHVVSDGLPGLDGCKMSKSYSNTIDLFEESKILRSKIAKIPTASTKISDPKTTENDNLFLTYCAFATPFEIEDLRERYQGAVSYKQIKDELFEKIDHELAIPRQKYREIKGDYASIDSILEKGATSARLKAQPVLQKAREAMGLGR